MGKPVVRPAAGKEMFNAEPPESDGARHGGGNAPPLDRQTTEELISARDRLLADCLELEAQLADTGADADAAYGLTDLRAQVDHIHEELAARDLAQRAAHEEAGNATAAAPPAAAGETAEDTSEILHAIESRSRFMDELAQAARQKGDLEQAATFALNAQRLDMERVDVLCRVRSKGCTRPHRDD